MKRKSEGYGAYVPDLVKGAAVREELKRDGGARGGTPPEPPAGGTHRETLTVCSFTLGGTAARNSTDPNLRRPQPRREARQTGRSLPFKLKMYP